MHPSLGKCSLLRGGVVCLVNDECDKINFGVCLGTYSCQIDWFTVQAMNTEIKESITWPSK